MFGLSYYEYKTALNNHESISDELLDTLTEGADNKMAHAVLSAPHANYIDFTADENVVYYTKLVDHLAEKFAPHMTEDEKKVCVGHMIIRILEKDHIDLAKMIQLYLEPANATVEEYSWLWVLRENLRYSLLFLYDKNIPNYEEMKKWIVILKPNREIFQTMWVDLYNKHTNQINKL